MTTSTDLPPTTRVTVLKHLASGKSLDIVATIVGLKREQVLDVASHHGYPDRDKLAWAVDVLEKKLDGDSAALPDRTDEVRREERAAAPRPQVVPSPAPAPAAPQSDAVSTTTHSLIDRGKQHESKRIRAAADKVLDDLDRLRTLLREDEEKHAERRKAAAEKAAARAEVERLEAQLAKARAKLRGGKTSQKKTTATTDGPTAAEIRAWAAQNDVACPAVGRVPTAVRQAYADAHPEAQAS